MAKNQMQIKGISIMYGAVQYKLKQLCWCGDNKMYKSRLQNSNKTCSSTSNVQAGRLVFGLESVIFFMYETEEYFGLLTVPHLCSVVVEDSHCTCRKACLFLLSDLGIESSQ